MDLNTVARIIPARHRDDLRLLGPGVVPLAGGSELFADPRIELTGLVDLLPFGWPALTVTADGGLEIAATCTLAELAAMPNAGGWAAHPLLYQCCTALFGSFKVWNVATVGGNLATALPAGPMITLAVALGADLLIWRGNGTAAGTGISTDSSTETSTETSTDTDEWVPAASFVTGNMTTILEPTDILRSVHVSANALASRTAFRKIALSPIGRSGAVLAGRLSPEGCFTLTVTGGTLRPILLAYAEVPPAATLATDIGAIDCWFTDAHGAADWRRAVSGILGEEIRLELIGDLREELGREQSGDRA